jgi:amino acid adenylation domain-containing protein
MQTNILDYLDSTVQKMPDKIAFKDDDSSISFITLKKQSKSIASYLINHIDTCKPVIVFNEKNVFTPVCFISVLYSGCFYVPIDTQLPKLRIEKILSIVNAEIMITDRKNIDKAKTLNYSGKIILIEDVVNTEIEEIKLDKIRQQNIDTDPIYIIFTSGSSGTPKGVVVSHRSLIDYIDVFTYITKIDENDVMANQTPFDYDGSVRDIYSTLKTGATTYIVPIKYFSTPLKLFEVLIEHKVTSLSWAVSALVIPVLMNIFTERVPLSIKRVMFSGSVMPCKYLSIWQKYLPDAMYINQYGPTECTGTSTYYIVPGKVSEDDILPIGKPYPNTKIILLNEDRKCVPHGEIGEIYISGTCLSKGYYNNHEKTMEVFIQNPINQYYPEILYKTGDLGRIRSDGILEFHGRNDSQIKYMGHRIELGEIESTALKKQEISRCSCLYQESKEMIWLFYVGDTDNKELSIYLRNLLPSFMIPRKFVRLDVMP